MPRPPHGIRFAPGRSMLPILLASFLAGVAGTPHCAGMCGPLVAAQARGTGQAVAWQTGKMATYAALGAVAASMGTLLPHLVSWGPALGAIAWLFLFWFALRLAGVPLPHVRFGERRLLALVARVPRGSKHLGPMALGALTGLLPCGLVYAALALALAAPSVLGGALAMVAFAVGTAPSVSLAAWGMRRAVLRSRGVRLAMAGAVLVLGTASLAHRATLGRQVADDPTLCHGE